MASFLIDEDLPRSIARGVVANGADAVHVIDVGLRGTADAGGSRVGGCPRAPAPDFADDPGRFVAEDHR